MNNQHWYIWCKLTVKTKPAYNYGYMQVLSTLEHRNTIDAPKKLKITQSFSNAGTPHDNAVMESFFAVFKKEEFYRSAYRSEAELRKKIDEYIAFYNQKRPHTTLNLQTPEQYEDAFFRKQ